MEVIVQPGVPPDAVPTGQLAAAPTSPRIPKMCVKYGPLDDRGVFEECHSFRKALPEMVQCMYEEKVPV